MPEIIIVAGPNGAGKTSFARQHINTGSRTFAFVNADEISRELSQRGIAPARLDLQAARLMLKRMDEFTAARENFMVETTLAALSYIDRVVGWRNMGYYVTLIYLRLPSAEHAVDRVRRRVAAGGHGIPEATIRRRFDMSHEYLEKYYKPVVDAWYIVNSFEGSYSVAESSYDP